MASETGGGAGLLAFLLHGLVAAPAVDVHGILYTPQFGIGMLLVMTGLTLLDLHPLLIGNLFPVRGAAMMALAAVSLKYVLVHPVREDHRGVGHPRGG